MVPFTFKTWKLSISRQALSDSRKQDNATRTSSPEPLRIVGNRNLEEKIDTEHDDSSPEGVEMRARWLAKEARSILEKRSNQQLQSITASLRVARNYRTGDVSKSGPQIIKDPSGQTVQAIQDVSGHPSVVPKLSTGQTQRPRKIEARATKAAKEQTAKEAEDAKGRARGVQTVVEQAEDTPMEEGRPEERQAEVCQMRSYETRYTYRKIAKIQ